MRYTLLDIVQTVLSALDSDEVNSITDTTESLQVAFIARRVYYRIASSAGLPEHKALFKLTASSSSTPVVMYRPSNTTSIEWIKYDIQTLTNTDTNYKYIIPLSVSDFMDMMHNKTEGDTNVSIFTLSTNDSSFSVLYDTDRMPSYYTSFNDGTILFDSIDTGVDSNLQESKTLCQGEVSKVFLFQDTFIPDLDEQQFDLLLNECISWASVELKQQVNPKAEEAARRGWITLFRTKEGIHVQSQFDRLPDYGRN